MADMPDKRDRKAEDEEFRRPNEEGVMDDATAGEGEHDEFLEVEDEDVEDVEEDVEE
jgi:hypothetical protein